MADVKKTVQIDLEVDTNTVDSSKNPFQWFSFDHSRQYLNSE